MSKNKEHKPADQKWKSESLRQQRRERLAELKAKDGGKKPLQYKNRKATIISTAIIVVLVIAIGLWAITSMGVLHRHVSAVTVGGENITAVEVSYYYRSLLNSYGINPDDSEGQTTLNSPSGMEEDQTVRQYLQELAASQIHEIVILSQYAKTHSLDLAEAEEEQLDAYMAQLQSAAAQNGVALDTYLSNAYGTGMNREALTDIFKRSFLADKASEHIRNSFTYTDQEMEEQYALDQDRYDVADYRVLQLPADIPSGATDAQREQAMEDAREQAEEMASRLDGEDSFRELALEYIDEDDREAYEADDLTLYENRRKTNISPLVVANWLFDEEREPNDTGTVESTSGYYVLYFIARDRPSYQHVDIRHILIRADRQTAGEAALSAAQEQAESILSDYLAGEQTEDSFAQLAREHSEDGNADRGGIYENVSPGQMVEEFDTWCFDSQRQRGDTEIVQTQFGFHVMYFSDWTDEAWIVNVRADLKNESFSTFLSDAKDENDLTVRRFGMRFVS